MSSQYGRKPITCLRRLPGGPSGTNGAAVGIGAGDAPTLAMGEGLAAGSTLADGLATIEGSTDAAGSIEADGSATRPRPRTAAPARNVVKAAKPRVPRRRGSAIRVGAGRVVVFTGSSCRIRSGGSGGRAGDRSVAAAAARGADVLARVRGWGAAGEPVGIGRLGRDGEAWARALRAAMAEAGTGPDGIDTVVSAASGYSLVDIAQTRALRLAGLDGRPQVAPKALLGETYGSAGALGLVAALASYFLAKALAKNPPVPLELTTWDDWRQVVGYGAIFAIAAIIAVSVGTIVRQSAGAIAILLLWPLIIESLFTMIPTVGEKVGPWLPFAASDKIVARADARISGGQASFELTAPEAPGDYQLKVLITGGGSTAAGHLRVHVAGSAR